LSLSCFCVLELAVIVPTLNERENVKALIGRLHEALAGIEWEVVFVDDDSPDGTAEFCRQIGRSDRRVRVVQRIARRGLASASIEGILATCAPLVAVMDGDLQHDETLIPGMVARLKAENLDLVVGSRNVEGGGMGRFAAGRVRLSNLGRILSRRVVSCELQDPMSGFFVADRRFVNEALPRISAVGFKILLDLIASSPRPVRLAEAPYEFRTRVRGESKLDTTVGFEYLTLVLHKLIGSMLPVQFVMFGLVGLAGVLVHLALLAILLFRSGLPFVYAHATATSAAIIANFFLNNVVTHRDRRLRGWKLVPGFLAFFQVCALGALSNFALAKLLYSAGLPWFFAGAAGMAVSSVWNYSVTAALSWRQPVHHRTTGGTVQLQSKSVAAR
jgi:dolichol-phosphate mannosyltransferase